MKPLLEWWAAQGSSRRAAVGVAALAMVLVVLVAVVAGSSSAQEPVEVAIVGTPASSGTAIPTSVATISAPEPGPTEVGVPTIRTLKELKERFGDPPTATRGRLRVPGLGIDAPIGVRAVPPSMQLPSPTGPADVVLYDFGARSEYGGMPGSGGNAVLSGHVDYSYKLPYVNANYTGLGVFALLKTAQPNSDQVQIVMDGRTITYTIEWVRVVSAEGGNWGQLLARDVGADAITIVTCDGAFNPFTQEYSDRTVVRAVRSS